MQASTALLLSQDDDRDAEEWERYEALHEDVDKQVSTTKSILMVSVQEEHASKLLGSF